MHGVEAISLYTSLTILAADGMSSKAKL